MSHPVVQNIIIFSAGESERNGNLEKVKEFLKKAGHRCHGWRELFQGANNASAVALLPMLLKKIPTFDFAIILGDGVDLLSKFRNEEVQRRIMRDNVLFETGLCTMALGADRVVLLMENDIRIPEDLHGVGVGNLGVEYLEYSNERQGDLEAKLERLLDYIGKKAGEIHPVVIGAAISTADGYFNNFILRFWENVEQGFVDAKSGNKDLIFPLHEKISMRILIPKSISHTLGGRIRKYYEEEGYRTGIIPTGEFRGVEFRYKMDEAGNLVVCDIPSTVTASYNTVVDILQLDADDEKDADAELRFLNKELDSFVRTLRKVMVEEKVAAKERSFKRAEEKIRMIVDGVKRVSLERVDL